MWLDLVLGSLVIRSCVRCGRTGVASLCDECKHVSLLRSETPGGVLVLSLGRYDGAPGDHVRKLKYEDETIRAARLGWALGALVPPEWRSHFLVPVPLHPARLVERGYNQSALLARAVGRRAGLRVRTDLLLRTRETRAQARLSRSERETNLSGALAARNIRTPLEIVVVDDVATTGHTLDACAQALASSGFLVRGALCCALAQKESTGSN